MHGQSTSAGWGRCKSPDPSEAHGAACHMTGTTSFILLDGERHEAHLLGRIEDEQGGRALALFLELLDPLAHVRDRRHRLSADVADDVAGIEAFRGIDRGHHHALDMVLDLETPA